MWSSSIRGFINYLENYKERKTTNLEPDNLNSHDLFYVCYQVYR